MSITPYQQQPIKPRPSLYRRIVRIVGPIFLICAVGSLGNQVKGLQFFVWGLWVSAGVLFVLFAIWWMTQMWRAGAAIGTEARIAMQGVPSPAEIAAHLEAEWGRPATFQEVAVTHQMLTSRHNQAMLNAGIGFGAIYLANRHDL